MKKGAFFVFEGIDGSGKTTQLRLLSKRLKTEGRKVCETREPTDGPVGSMINQILKKRLAMEERVTASLFAADRLDHLLNPHNGICRMIEDGIHVLSDRYYLSSFAYNGSRVPLDWVLALNSQAAEILRPTAHIFIDVTPETALKRIADGRFETELYEDRETLGQVRKKFYEVFELLKERENILIIDGNETEDRVAEKVWEQVLPYLK